MHSISRRGLVAQLLAPQRRSGPMGHWSSLGPLSRTGRIPIQMCDGIWEKAHGPGFIKNAPIDAAKAALKAGDLTDEFVPITFTVTAVRIKGQVILFDAGAGNQVFPKAGALSTKTMQAAGLDQAQIKTINHHTFSS
jgi:hypothetical protein